jgi:anti-sigma factor RsiW
VNDCEAIRDYLPLYAGGELEENERVAVDAHLSMCAGCARELDGYREDLFSLAALRDEEPPAAALKAIAEGVRAELFPRRALALYDAVLRYAAVLVVGLAIGAAWQFVHREPAPVPVARPAELVPVQPRHLPTFEVMPASGTREF